MHGGSVVDAFLFINGCTSPSECTTQTHSRISPIYVIFINLLMTQRSGKETVVHFEVRLIKYG